MASRVAKNPIQVPSNVEVRLAGQEITIKGKQGQLHYVVHPEIKILHENNVLRIVASNENNNTNALAGCTRALVNNMVVGVNEGFQRKLILIGVGYRAKAQGKSLNLTLGFSHPVDFTMPDGISVETPSNTEIIIKGADKRLVSQVAADIRAVRPVECYKGKGIRYEGELIILKEGKKK